MGIGVLPTYISVHHVPEEGTRSPRNGVPHGCEPLHRCQELNPGSVKE